MQRIPRPSILRSLVTTTTTSTGTSSSSATDYYYLHIGPSAGDCWTSTTDMFAAKHLPPEYVKSIRLRADLISPELVVELVEQDNNLQHSMYDAVGDLDAADFLLQRLSKEPTTTAPSDA